MRRLIKAASTFFCVAALTTVLSPGARANVYDKTSTLIFSGSVEIPGVSQGICCVARSVQVFTQDQRNCLATIMAVPNTRLMRSDKTVITLRERPNGEPPAPRAWFYPDAQWGDESAYGKKKAKEIAQVRRTPVLYNNSDTNENAEVAEPIEARKPAEAQEMNLAEAKAYNPTGDEVELSQTVTPPTPAEMSQNTPPAQAAPAPTTSSTALTRTPLSLAGGFGVNMLRQTCS